MADVTITPQELSVSGITPSYTDVSAITDDFYLANNGHTILHVKNDSAGSINVTITGQNNCDQGFTHDETIAVGAGVEKIIGVFSVARFNDNSNGKVLINFDTATDVSYTAYKGV
jgi:hypothetical protein